MFGSIVVVNLTIPLDLCEQDVIRELNRHVFKNNIFKSNVTTNFNYKQICLQVRITEDIEEFEFVQGMKTLTTPTREYIATIY
jgi:hypothetical protein